MCLFYTIVCLGINFDVILYLTVHKRGSIRADYPCDIEGNVILAIKEQIEGYLKSKYLLHHEDSEKWLFNIESSTNFIYERWVQDQLSRNYIDEDEYKKMKFKGSKIGELIVEIKQFLIPIEASLNEKMKPVDEGRTESTRAVDSPKG